MDPTKNGNGPEGISGLERDLQSIREVLDEQVDTEPPSMIDQAVLNAAKRELDINKRRSRRWIGAFATATVVVLAVTLVIQQEQLPPPVETMQTDSVLEEMRSEADSLQQAQPTSPDSSGAIIGAREKQAGADSETPAKSKAESSFRKDNEPATGPAPAPEPARQSFADEAKEISRDDPDSRDSDQAAELILDETAEEGNEQPSIAGQSRRESEELLGNETTDPADGRFQRADKPENDKDDSSTGTLNPSLWIEQMLNLKREQDLQRLEMELEAFKAAYPDYPLPAELVELTP